MKNKELIVSPIYNAKGNIVGQEYHGELIRCKDCKHYKKEIRCVGGHYNGCGWWLDEGCESPVDEDGYCSYAERKDNG